MKVIFGSRGSDLALTQTKAVIRRFKDAHPGVEIELRVIRTTGDNKPEASLAEIGGLGAFTREIESALLDREVDVAVHSLKDLPTKQPGDLCVAAIAGRQNPSDVLISNYGYTLDSLPKNAVVGTSSLRRKAQLLVARPDLQIRELRGNVPTRIRRVRDGELDATVLAMAGLVRLELTCEQGLWEVPLAIMLPAPGQGALALETRSDDAPLRALLATLHDEEAALAVNCERAALCAFGGGCRAPLGVYAKIKGDEAHIWAFAADMDTGKALGVTNVTSRFDAIRAGQDIGSALRDGLRKESASCACFTEACDHTPEPIKSRAG